MKKHPASKEEELSLENYCSKALKEFQRSSPWKQNVFKNEVAQDFRTVLKPCYGHNTIILNTLELRLTCADSGGFVFIRICNKHGHVLGSDDPRS